MGTFLTLAQTMNYQKAAEELNFAPSTLNRHIGLLEQELGVKLFRKAGKWLEMTREGTAFLEYAAQMMDLYRAALRAMGEAGERSICIAGCEITLAHCLMDVFSAFSGRYPSIRLSTLASANARTPELIRSGAAEIGFYYTLSGAPLEETQGDILFGEPVRLVTAANNPIAARQCVRYEHLTGVNFAFPHDDCCAAVEILRRLGKRGVDVGRVSYLGVMQLVMEQVRQNMAVMVLPDSAARNLCESMGFCMLRLQEEDVNVYARILYRDRKQLCPEARMLAEFCMENAEEMLTVGKQAGERASGEGM